jgi:uncharacterized membrane protein (UPF0136 family)
MRFEAVALVIYGLLVAAGGYLGFRKAGSRASLAGGLRAGAAVVIASVLALSGARPGFWLVLLFSSALTIFFAYRLIKTRKPMPSVPMIALSVAAALLCVWALRR